MSQPGYIGRFAPSPTGPLHAGSLVAALASWLDARAHGGQWLVRIENVDTPRCIPGADLHILQQLAACGLYPDQPPLWQSQRSAIYQQALEQLASAGLAYPCACSRKDIEVALAPHGQAKPRHGELVYPGTCRNGLHGRAGRAWRLRTDAPTVHWSDRRLGRQAQDVQTAVGDFVLRRTDGYYAYQLAVVVDDAAQAVTHIVRGEDLADNTARQILLQQALNLPTPQYLHTPLVLGTNGEKLSKQNGATALNLSQPLTALNQAANSLGLTEQTTSMPAALAFWVNQWQQRYTTKDRESRDPKIAATMTAPNPTDSAPAAPKPFMRTIRSFVLRAGRTTTGQAKAMEKLGPRYLLPYQKSSVDLAAIFANSAGNTKPESSVPAAPAPLVLEIGFGMGEATAHIAAVLPHTHFLCCEVHAPGVGALLKRIGEQGLSNIRICAHDAVEVIDHMLPLQSLDGVHIFFPDPWHKTKHNKRRLIQAPLVAKLAARLKVGGYLHCATDWQPYAEQILEVLSAEPLLRNRALATHPQLAGYAPKPHYRPLTKFEHRGIQLGHGVWDLVFERI